MITESLGCCTKGKKRDAESAQALKSRQDKRSTIEDLKIQRQIEKEYEL